MRRPNWPCPWLELSVKVGGSVALRGALGYSSKSTLSGKIADPTKWRRADALLLASVLRRYPSADLKLTDLIELPVLESLLTGAELIEAGVVVF